MSSFIQVLSLKRDLETVVKMPCHLVWYCNGSGVGWGKEEFSIALMKLCPCANKLQRGSDIFFSSAKWYLSFVCWAVVHSSHLFQCFPVVILDSHFFTLFFSPSPSEHSREILGTSLQGQYDKGAPASELRE